jgi:starch synthase
VVNALGPAIHQWDSLLGEPARLLSGKLNGHPLLVVDSPNLFAREGGPYADLAGRDWGDNWRRFAAFARAAADVAGGAVKGLPSIWPTRTIGRRRWPRPICVSPGGTPIPSVMTIHNMAFQGYYGSDIFALLELPSWAWAIDGVEYHGGVGFLKAGLKAPARSPRSARPMPARSAIPRSAWGWKG